MSSIGENFNNAWLTIHWTGIYTIIHITETRPYISQVYQPRAVLDSYSLPSSGGPSLLIESPVDMKNLTVHQSPFLPLECTAYRWNTTPLRSSAAKTPPAIPAARDSSSLPSCWVFWLHLQSQPWLEGDLLGIMFTVHLVPCNNT